MAIEKRSFIQHSDGKKHRVEIAVDWDWLARQVCANAITNKTQKTSSMAGAIKAKVIKESP